MFSSVIWQMVLSLAQEDRDMHAGCGRHSRQTLIVAGILMATCLAASAGPGCPQTTIAKERQALQAKLSANGYLPAEKAFLLRGASARVNEIRRDALNARGRECGLESVKAHIFRCTRQTLPSSVPGDRKTTTSLWGRSNISARETVFIGMFHACRAGAIKAFVKS